MVIEVDCFFGSDLRLVLVRLFDVCCFVAFFGGRRVCGKVPRV